MAPYCAFRIVSFGETNGRPNALQIKMGNMQSGEEPVFVRTRCLRMAG